MVNIIECPRDAWQGLPGVMPAEVKADYLRVLIAAGFKHVDAVSFVSKISLADTVGVATPRRVADLFADVRAVHDRVEIGLHLHTRPETAGALVEAAYTAGCRRFDAALGGLGGCPFAQDALLGNLPTELLLTELRRLGAELPDFGPLDGLLAGAQAIERKYGARVQ